MKLTWDGRGTDGRFRLRAEPEEYDGCPPIAELLLEHDPLLVHDDVLSVASVLVFGEYCSGGVRLPRKVSPEVAAAIERFLSPAWVQISPVEFAPRANPTGNGTLVLTKDMTGMKPRSHWGESRISTLVSLDSQDFSGTLVSTHGLITNSNASTIAALGRDASGVLVHLAVALIYSETLFASTIVLANDLVCEANRNEIDRAAKLLESCKMNLLVEGMLGS